MLLAPCLVSRSGISPTLNISFTHFIMILLLCIACRTDAIFTCRRLSCNIFVGCATSNNDLLSVKHDILGKSLPNITSNMCFMKTQISTSFIKVRVSAARVLLATLWIFLDYQNMGASNLFFPFRKINIPLRELSSSRFAYDVSGCMINSDGGSNLQKYSVTVHNFSFLRILLALCAS